MPVPPHGWQRAMRRAASGEDEEPIDAVADDEADDGEEEAALSAERIAELGAAEQAAALAADAVDVTLPGRRPRRGTHHIIQQVMDEIVDLFGERRLHALEPDEAGDQHGTHQRECEQGRQPKSKGHAPSVERNA